jgi:hypothetical protein
MAIEWQPTGGQNWTGMGPEAFDTGTAPEQVSLFEPTVGLVKPKAGPQLDLFSEPDDSE